MKKNNYITVLGWMVSELGLSGNELLCYALIYGFSQDGQGVFSGTSTYISKWINVSKRTTFDILCRLVEKGLIRKIEKTVNGVKLYDYAAVLEGGEKTSYLVKNLHRGSEESARGSEETSHHIYINNNKDNNNPPLYSPLERVEKKPNEKDKYKEVFEEFWKAYPKQRIGNKQKAYLSYVRVLQEKRASVEQLLSSVKAYACSREVSKGFAKGCQAWLNDDRFNVDYSAEQQNYLEDIFK